MGVSTDAILFYGYHFEEGTEIPDALQELHGPDEKVMVDYHCSDEVPMPYLYVQESQTTAYRGGPQPVEPGNRYHAGWDLWLQDFAKEHGLPLPEQDGASALGWWLASWWG